MMTIKYSPYSMFDAFDDSSIQVVVNTINCVGIMGKGLALEFKMRYPEMLTDYLERFREDSLKVGEPYLFKTSGKWILNFPTKDHWRYPSKIEYIESGLKYFVSHYKGWDIKSIAFPRLGCTSGNLEWSEVQPIMERFLSSLKGLDVYIFLDQEPSENEKRFVGLFNESQMDVLGGKFKLTEKQINSIKSHIKKHGRLKRMRDLLVIRGIGPVAYKRTLDRKNIPIDSQGEFRFG